MKSTTFALVAAAIPFAFAAPLEKRENYQAVYVTDLKLTTVTTQLTVYYTGQPAASTVYATPAPAAAAPTDAPAPADVFTYVAPVAAAAADVPETVESAPAPAADVASVQPETVVQQSAPVDTSANTPAAAPAAAPVAASSFGSSSNYPQTGDASYDSSTGAFQANVLDATNKWRAEFQAAPLSWDDSLASAALNSAKQCSLLHVGGPDGSGQNIASGFAGPDAVCDGWGNEYKKYNFANPTWDGGAAGHFTALVWQDTKQLGCAAYWCGGDGVTTAPGWNTICNYFPAGNYVDSYKSNVLPKTS